MGMFDKIKNRAKQAIENKQQDLREQRAANRIIRVKARAAGFREREQQAIQTAKFRAQQRGKTQRTVRPAGSFGGLGAGLNALVGTPTGKKKQKDRFEGIL